MSDATEQTISPRRLEVLESEVYKLMDGLGALSSVGGRLAGEAIPTEQVHWFAARLEEHGNAIMRLLDPCQPEPAPKNAEDDA